MRSLFYGLSLLGQHQRIPKLIGNSTRRLLSIKGMNPLLEIWPEGVPPFARIDPSHFKEAFDKGFEENLSVLAALVKDPLPSFESTIVKFDRAAPLLTRVAKVFYNLCASQCPPELQAIQTQMAAPLAAHRNDMYHFPGLFDKIQHVYNTRHDSLTGEDLRLVERVFLDFERAGAALSAESKARNKQIVTRLAELMTQFTQNVMADESSYTLELDDDSLQGLPSFLLEAAKQAANERGQQLRVITLSRSIVVPFLTFSERRDLREKAWRAWISRGELDPARDNCALIKEILLLRLELAQLLGYHNYAEYNTADTMAKTPGNVMELLEKVWTPAKASALKEKALLEEYISTLPAEQRHSIEPWDWRFLAEKVRAQKFDLEEAAVKPFFPLSRMTSALFDCAFKLFGIRFTPRPDIVTYHPDVAAYEVSETVDGKDTQIGLFLHDNYSRQYKKSGAWMSDFRSQSRTVNDGSNVTPIIINNNNFAKSEHTLLSFDDAVTLFHEFGHGLHGLLSNVHHERLAGTRVLVDFVELPSQLFEHWVRQPEVLRAHALHVDTNQPISEELLSKLFRARAFNEGFATVEYTACALIDQALHALSREEILALNVVEFELKEQRRLGMPSEIVPRHRLPHFQHLFSGSQYAALYYVYLWAEVLDADGFDAFKETNNIFDPAVANRARKYIYSSGNSIEPSKAFQLFRGRDPVVEPMLKKKCLRE